jgi:hypothetical protein
MGTRTRRNPAVFAILVGGFIAGVLDITYAIVFSGFRGVSAVRVLQSVASGLLGSAASEGGLSTAVLGLFLHFFIAFSIAAIFYAASRRLPFLTRQAVLSGLLYGIVVYGVMNLVVLPLSAYPRKITFTPLYLTINLVAHMFFIGLPIALATRRANSQAFQAST